MYTTIIHPIRKAYNLSMNEYAVLDTIYHLSNNVKFGGWCIMSKIKIGETLDLSKQTVHSIIDTLIEKGLVEKNDSTKAIRSCDEWNTVISNKNDWIIGLDVDGVGILSGIVKKVDSQSRKLTTSQESLPPQSRNLTPSSQESLPYNNIYNNNKNNNIYNGFSEKTILAFQDFILHRKQMKSPLTEKAIKLNLNKISHLQEDEQVKTINKSIEYGWKGLFPDEQKQEPARKNYTIEETPSILSLTQTHE